MRNDPPGCGLLRCSRPVCEAPGGKFYTCNIGQLTKVLVFHHLSSLPWLNRTCQRAFAAVYASRWHETCTWTGILGWHTRVQVPLTTLTKYLFHLQTRHTIHYSIQLFFHLWCCGYRINTRHSDTHVCDNTLRTDFGSLSCTHWHNVSLALSRTTSLPQFQAEGPKGTPCLPGIWASIQAGTTE